MANTRCIIINSLIFALLHQSHCQSDRLIGFSNERITVKTTSQASVSTFISNFFSSFGFRYLQSSNSTETPINGTSIIDIPGCPILTLYPTSSPSPSSSPTLTLSPTLSSGPSSLILRSNDIADTDMEGDVNGRFRARKIEEVSKSKSKKSKKTKSSKQSKSKKGHHVRDGHRDHGDPDTYVVDRCGQITYLTDPDAGMFSSLTSPGSINLMSAVGALSILYFLRAKLFKKCWK